MRNADNLPPSCAVVNKSGHLNFLEPSGPVQACNGTALPLPVRAGKAFTEDLPIYLLCIVMSNWQGSEPSSFHPQRKSKAYLPDTVTSLH